MFLYQLNVICYLIQHLLENIKMRYVNMQKSAYWIVFCLIRQKMIKISIQICNKSGQWVVAEDNSEKCLLKQPYPPNDLLNSIFAYWSENDKNQYTNMQWLSSMSGRCRRLIENWLLRPSYSVNDLFIY